MEFFLHPWYMIAGGALVSSPIIIHLINRMRFKRIRWAAMEFLLKSQKRNRRRLIIEQMILLFLRILLVLLIAFLVARFVGGALGSTQQGIMHVVVVDDTVSMGDRFVKEGAGVTAMDTARDQLSALVKNASLASAAQHLRVYLLSDLERAVFDEAISDQTEAKLSRILGDVRPTYLHIPPAEGVRKAFDVLQGAPQGQKILHFVSDFRHTDWVGGRGAQELQEDIGRLLENQINLSLIDIAHPFRNETSGVALSHDNLAIVGLEAESTRVAAGLDVKLIVKVKNFGTQEARPTISIKVNGREDFRGSTRLSIPPLNDPDGADGKGRHEFVLSFQKQSDAPAEYFHVSAEIAPAETGLDADLVRDMVIEVRDRIPVLVVDGSGEEGMQPGGDAFHLSEAFNASRAYQAVIKAPADLVTLDLEAFTSIYLLNVPQLPDEAVVKLKDYASNGGSVAFFLGPNVQARFYNEKLHQEQAGLFPVMVAARPTDPLGEQEKADRRQKDEQAKILFPTGDTHPIVKEGGLFPFRSVFRFLIVDRYYPVQPQTTWHPDSQKESLAKVLVLPTRKSIDEFKSRAQDLGRQMVDLATEVAGEDKEFGKYLPVLEALRREITRSLEEQYVFQLVRVLDLLLNDPGEQNNEKRPDMRQLWQHPKLQFLGKQIEDFKETVEFGDPLLVARPYGKGKVVAFLTSAGTTSGWNEWGGGSPVSWTYPVFVMDLQRYLTTQIGTHNRLVTSQNANVQLAFPAASYLDRVSVSFTPQPVLRERGENDQGKAAATRDLAQLTMSKGEDDEQHTLTWNEARLPGVYHFRVTHKDPQTGRERPETYSYAFNIDAAAEGDLRRAVKEKLEKPVVLTEEQQASAARGKVLLFSPGDSFEGFKSRDPDASESPWLYLLFLIILVVEQALAVHLSFHLKETPAGQAAPAARPAAAAA